MKLFIVGLLALVITLGVSCKKENVQPQEVVKKEVLNKKANAEAVEGLEGGIGGYPGGQYTYPHNTGACICGKYPKCNPPLQHRSWCTVYSMPEMGCTCTVTLPK